jgi:hypothetical protein
LRALLTTKERQNGSFKIASLTNGSQQARSYGFTANVRSSLISASHFLIISSSPSGIWEEHLLVRSRSTHSI